MEPQKVGRVSLDPSIRESVVELRKARESGDPDAIARAYDTVRSRATVPSEPTQPQHTAHSVRQEYVAPTPDTTKVKTEVPFGTRRATPNFNNQDTLVHLPSYSVDERKERTTVPAPKVASEPSPAQAKPQEAAVPPTPEESASVKVKDISDLQQKLQKLHDDVEAHVGNHLSMIKTEGGNEYLQARIHAMKIKVGDTLDELRRAEENVTKTAAALMRIPAQPPVQKAAASALPSIGARSPKKKQPKVQPKEAVPTATTSKNVPPPHTVKENANESARSVRHTLARIKEIVSSKKEHKDLNAAGTDVMSTERPSPDVYSLMPEQTLWQAIDVVGKEGGVFETLPHGVDVDDVISEYFTMNSIDTSIRPETIPKEATVQGLTQARDTLEHNLSAPPLTNTAAQAQSPLSSTLSTEKPQSTPEVSREAHITVNTQRAPIRTPVTEPHVDVVAPRTTMEDSASAAASTPEQDTHAYIAEALKEAGAPQHPRGVDRSRDLRGEAMTPEVTAGLMKLLSQDWKYFTKSGFFGTGPAGMEHPTYQAIKNLSVRNIMEGKWNDADMKLADEVRQFVGSWQREQGVTPIEDEPFEMYLRRVVGAILERQKSISQRTAPVAA